MDKYYIVYKTENLVNGKIYIGVHESCCEHDDYLGSGVYISEAIEKYGKENFKRENLMYCASREEMLSIERVLVNRDFITRKDTYNICLGGGGGNRWANSSDEERIANAKYRSDRAKELSKGWFNSESQSINGRIGGFKSKGRKYYNDGHHVYSYSIEEQNLMSFDDFMTNNPHLKPGRLGANGGSKWYNDGYTDFKYTLKDQSKVSFDEFISNNPCFEKGRITNRKYKKV